MHSNLHGNYCTGLTTLWILYQHSRKPPIYGDAQTTKKYPVFARRQDNSPVRRQKRISRKIRCHFISPPESNLRYPWHPCPKRSWPNEQPTTKTQPGGRVDRKWEMGSQPNEVTSTHVVNNLRKQLSDTGYATEIQTIQIKGKILQRIQVENFTRIKKQQVL